jgi:hypothetical protein
MIQYTNIQRRLNIPFNEYQKFNGYSHSFLKSEINGVSPEFIASEKVKLGSLVDAILTQDDKVDYADPQFNVAMKIAIEIKDKFGVMIKQFVPQVSYTAMASYGGLQMPITGRLDWELPKHAVIDLKVTGAKTDKEFATLIALMGYDNQLFNYCKMAGVTKGYLMPYSTSAKKCLSVVSVPIMDRNIFWESKILKFGKLL